MTYVDCHLHISDKFFYKRIDDLMIDWNEYDVESIGAVATNLRESQRNLEVATRYPSIIRAGIGRHPWGAHKFTEQELMIFKGLAQKPEVAFIGEVGLDHFHIKEKDRWLLQEQVLEQFIAIANESKKSLMLHQTGAEEELYEMLSTRELEVNFCCHWYSGSDKILKKLIDLGGFFSINPNFSRSRKHRRILDLVDQHNLLTESDGPVKFQGEQGSPILIPLLCNEIAKELMIKPNDFAEIVKENYNNYLKN
ncbi:MAG: TatD family deoxyribonuclease [Asgard group archaeon]|nr:TatD family deoxyribonuclease [Asgard group archaeon]